MAAHQLGAAVWITAAGTLGLSFAHCFGQIQQRGRRQWLTLSHRDQLGPQIAGVGIEALVEHTPTGVCQWGLETGQHRVHPIGAGAAHQSEHQAGPPWEPHSWGRPSSA